MRLSNPHMREVPVRKVSRLQRQIRRAQDAVPQVVETVLHVVEVELAGQGQVEHAQAMKLVRYRDHEESVVGAVTTVAVARPRGARPDRVCLRG